MEFEVSRNKNIMSFLAEGKTKPYTFDINTGILYSMQNKPLKNLPSTLHGYLGRHKSDDAVIYLMREMIDNYYSFPHEGWSFKLSMYPMNAKMFMIADKMQSIGYVPITKGYYRELTESNLLLVDEHFKLFAKYVKETDEPTIYDFVNEVYPIAWAEENGIEVNEVFTVEFINKLLNANYTEKQLKYIISVVCRGGMYFFTDRQGNFSYYSFLEKIDTYFHFCDVLDIKYEKDFYRGYINAQRMYLVHKAEFDNLAIQKQYQKHNFAFENDEFTIVIPQTSEDFKDEATQQGNCVYSCYLEYVVRGETNVVFIRKKSNPDKSYITCEISNKGQIRQYLAKHNRRVESTNAIDFKHKLQDWLNENWE